MQLTPYSPYDKQLFAAGDPQTPVDELRALLASSAQPIVTAVCENSAVTDALAWDVAREQTAAGNVRLVAHLLATRHLDAAALAACFDALHQGGYEAQALTVVNHLVQRPSQPLPEALWDRLFTLPLNARLLARLVRNRSLPERYGLQLLQATTGSKGRRRKPPRTVVNELATHIHHPLVAQAAIVHLLSGGRDRDLVQWADDATWRRAILAGRYPMARRDALIDPVSFAQVSMLVDQTLVDVAHRLTDSMERTRLANACVRHLNCDEYVTVCQGLTEPAVLFEFGSWLPYPLESLDDAQLKQAAVDLHPLVMGSQAAIAAQKLHDYAPRKLRADYAALANASLSIPTTQAEIDDYVNATFNPCCDEVAAGFDGTQLTLPRITLHVLARNDTYRTHRLRTTLQDGLWAIEEPLIAAALATPVPAVTPQRTQTAALDTLL